MQLEDLGHGLVKTNSALLWIEALKPKVVLWDEREEDLIAKAKDKNLREAFPSLSSALTRIREDAFERINKKLF